MVSILKISCPLCLEETIIIFYYNSLQQANPSFFTAKSMFLEEIDKDLYSQYGYQ